MSSGFQTSNPPGKGGGSGNNIYQGASPTTITVGGEPAGTNIFGKTVQQILEEILVPYIAPTFGTFTMQGQSQTVEVGDTISGNKTFAWSFNTPANVAPNTMDILDVTNNVTLASNISTVSPHALILPTPIQKTLPATHSWRGQADNTQSGTFQSALFTITWLWKIFVGTNTNPTLTEADIEALIINNLASNFSGTYNLAAGGYKYFCFPNSFGSPTAVTGFKDAATNLQLAMANNIDNPFFNSVQNGWFYGTVSVTNGFGITTNYRVYRTKNQLGGTLQAIVS